MKFLGIEVEWTLNVTAQAQKPQLVFLRNGRVHLNRRGRQFSGLLAVEQCGSAGSDCVIFSKYVDHNLKMSLQGGRKRVKRSGERISEVKCVTVKFLWIK